MRVSSPEEYERRRKALVPTLYSQYQPAQDRLGRELPHAIRGEQEGISSDFARYGQESAPLASEMRQGAARGAQGRLDESLSRFYEDALRKAMQGAGVTQRATMAAIGGVPPPQFGPGAAAGAADAAGTALSLYLLTL